MKMFFHSVLYINVCLVSLFFIIWLLTSVLMADAKTSLEPANINNQTEETFQGEPLPPEMPDDIKRADDDIKRAGDDIKRAGDDIKRADDDIKRADDDIKKVDTYTNKDIPTSTNDILQPEDTAIQKIDKNIQMLNVLLSPYLYNPEEAIRKNPFSSLLYAKKTQVSEIPTYPTGKYNLNEINLVGIKWNSRVGPSTALLKTPDNIIHTMYIHDQIGKNRGVIYQIKEDEIVILEPRLTGSINEKESAYVPIIMRLARWKNVNTVEVFDQIKE